jgi:hypothetical protein
MHLSPRDGVSYSTKCESLSLTFYAANRGDKKRYPAKTPRTQRKVLVISTNGRNLSEIPRIPSG